MKSANKVVFSGIWYTISNFMIKGMVFLTVPIFARLMDKSQFGDYSNYTTWLHLLMVIVSFNLYASVNISPSLLLRLCVSTGGGLLEFPLPTVRHFN